MAFIQAAVPLGQGTCDLLSADNDIPERHIVVDTLRKASPLLGLKPPVVATLEAMLSCLAPKRNHHTVFASNVTLTFRRNGISDRTIRRHAATLQEAGLLVRNDSPNRKRYTRHNSVEGKSMRFGFDLTPLFKRLHELAGMATAAVQEQERIDYLRSKVRAAANATLSKHPNGPDALRALKLLRRKLAATDLEMLLAPLSEVTCEGASDTRTAMEQTNDLSASAGQNVRHHHKSIKEHTDKEEAKNKKILKNTPPLETLSIKELLEACPEAAQFSPGKIETVDHIIAHARTLAPMIGIDNSNYHEAQAHLGPLGAAVTVWAILQFHDRIQRVGAYFRSITSGKNSSDFDPFKLVKRLATQRPVTAFMG